MNKKHQARITTSRKPKATDLVIRFVDGDVRLECAGKPIAIRLREDVAIHIRGNPLRRFFTPEHRKVSKGMEKLSKVLKDATEKTVKKAMAGAKEK